MNFLKQYWFSLLNGIVLLSSLIFYFVAVAGQASLQEESVDTIEREGRLIRNIMRKKPTSEWYKSHQENLAQLEAEQKQILMNYISKDKPLELFFSLNQPDVNVAQIPDSRDRLIFKEIMAKKWDQLIKKYGIGKDDEKEKKGFWCSKNVLTALEPSWLRNTSNPKSDREIVESQKRYWIVQEVLEILEANKVRRLEKFHLNSPQSHKEFQYEGKDVWLSRKLEFDVQVDSKSVFALMQAIYNSRLRFRVTAFEQENLVMKPLGVSSDAIFVTFKKDPLVLLKLQLHHYDFIQDGEELYLEEQSGQGNRPKRGRGRRGRR